MNRPYQQLSDRDRLVARGLIKPNAAAKVVEVKCWKCGSTFQMLASRKDGQCAPCKPPRRPYV